MTVAIYPGQNVTVGVVQGRARHNAVDTARVVRQRARPSRFSDLDLGEFDAWMRGRTQCQEKRIQIYGNDRRRREPFRYTSRQRSRPAAQVDDHPRSFGDGLDDVEDGVEAFFSITGVQLLLCLPPRVPLTCYRHCDRGHSDTFVLRVVIAAVAVAAKIATAPAAAHSKNPWPGPPWVSTIGPATAAPAAAHDMLMQVNQV